MEEKTPDYTLEHPRVQAAKRRYEKNEACFGTKSRLGFDEIFMFLKKGKPQRYIAKKAQIRVNAMQRKIKKYFRSFFGPQNTANIPTKVERTQKVVSTEPRTALARHVAAYAHSFGCTVEQVPWQTSRGSCQVHRSLLNICGALCGLHEAQSVRLSPKGNHRAYVVIHLSEARLRETDFTVMHIHPRGYPPEIYIVPSSILLKALFAFQGEKNRQKCLHIPLRRSGIRFSRSSVDLTPFLSAWDQLPSFSKK